VAGEDRDARRGRRSPEALAAAKARWAELGDPIPPSYRAFLAEQDGGKPVRD